MLDPSVEYPYLRIRGDRKVGEDFLIAIDMNEMVFFTKCGSSLIENSAGSPTNSFSAARQRLANSLVGNDLPASCSRVSAVASSSAALELSPTEVGRSVVKIRRKPSWEPSPLFEAL